MRRVSVGKCPASTTSTPLSPTTTSELPLTHPPPDDGATNAYTPVASVTSSYDCVTLPGAGRGPGACAPSVDAPRSSRAGSREPTAGSRLTAGTARSDRACRGRAPADGRAAPVRG